MHSIAWRFDPVTHCPAGYLIQHMVPMNSNYFLLCDGRPLQASQYPELYKAIGTNFGGGNGMFNLPNMMGARIIVPDYVYQEYWETWPCGNCGKIFSEKHDRGSWWCLKEEEPGTLYKTYRPMTNLEFLELKVTNKEKQCTDAESTAV